MDQLFDDIGVAFEGFKARNALEVAVIALVIYSLLRLIRGTTAMTVVRGMSILAVGLVVLSRVLDSVVLDWLVNNALAVFVLFVLIVFQPEFRRALERVGRGESYADLVPVVAAVAGHLSARRYGGLIVIERETGLQDVVETGVPVDAVPTAALLEGIFVPNTPLHDGAVVLRPGRVIAASCMLPASSEVAVGDEHLGTRHRAAVGISEVTDAIAVVVSEETGAISLAINGRLIRRLDQRRLESLLAALLNGNSRAARRQAAAASV